MPYIMYSKFQRFICFIFDFMMFLVVLEQNFTHPRLWTLCFSCQNCFFSSPVFRRLRANFEPKTCRFRAYNVPISSSTGAVFEPRSCQFRAQEDILSGPNRADFVPESCIFRALFVLLSSPFVLCPFEHWLLKYVARQNLAIFFSRSVSASITGLIHGNWHTWKDSSKKNQKKKRVSERAVHWNRCDEHVIWVVQLDQRKTMSFNGRTKKISRYLNKLLIYRRG